MKCRPEIDGLRALAVLPVIFFHAGFSIVSGGFIGVDIFFVISGYLITSLILEELAKGKFSLVKFYERRARRILPALYVVMLAIIPFAYFWMLPSQHLDFSQSLMAVVLFGSNILFWRESGYFAAVAAEKPLLHTWSLGVEEQYYLLFPLALLLLWRLGKQRAFYAVAITALLSFALCEYASRYYINANFFLIITRAWELFVGSICAFMMMNRKARSHDGLAVLGLGLIVAAIFVLDEQMRLPSSYTLAPVIGTALIVLYGTAGTWVARALSWRPVVSIGLISYSAYLWHYPLFAFARMRLPSTPPSSLMLALIAVTFVLAALSWRFVEQPFRNKKHRHYVSSRRALRMAGCTAAFLMAVGAYGYFSNGRLSYWTTHAPSNQVRAFQLIEVAKNDQLYDNGDCMFTSRIISEAIVSRLLQCHKKYGPGIAVTGDSHAMNLFFVLKERAGDRPFMVSFSQGMCRPHSPLPTCNYGDFVALLKNHPSLFQDVIYEQAGFHLLQNAQGKEINQDDIYGLPLDTAVPDFAVNMTYVDRVVMYLSEVARYGRVTWLGPRLEPEIRDTVMIHQGCDYPFQLRPNQENLFKYLDETIRERLTNSGIHYRSQIKLMRFDMAQDFMNCEHGYWRDTNHYSPDGETRFGQRITLDKVLPDWEAP